MRSMLLGVAVFALAQTAWAEPVTLTPIGFSPEMQTALEEDLGQREGQYLQRAVQDAVTAALRRRGAAIGPDAPLSIEIVIVDADPNKPTMQQTIDRPGLDPLASSSLGGAALHAVLRDREGNIVATVDHRHYDHSLADATLAATTWSTARRSIHRFAQRVADAYVANAG